MKKKIFFTQLLLSIFALVNGQVDSIDTNNFRHKISSDQRLFYVNLYVDDISQNEPFEMYFLDSINNVYKPEIFCDTCHPKVFIKPDFYNYNTFSSKTLTFVYSSNNYKIKTNPLEFYSNFIDIDIGVLTKPQELCKRYSRKELSEMRKKLKNDSSLTVNMGFAKYLRKYYLYNTPHDKHSFHFYFVQKRTKQIQYIHISGRDSRYPEEDIIYIGNRHTAHTWWWRYWRHRLMWYFP